MSWLQGVRRYVRLPRRGVSQIEREIDDELRFHLDMRAQELRERRQVVPVLWCAAGACRILAHARQ